MCNNFIKDIVTDDDSIENLNEVIQHINNIVPFIGAGMSVSMGYKTWYIFLNSELNSLAKDPNLRQNVKDVRKKLSKKEYLEVADEINKMYNNDLYGVIRREFAPKKKEETAPYISALQQIGCKTILTTNYDNILESQMIIDDITPEIVLPYSSYDIINKDKEGEPLIVKLHGNYDNPDSIVLTKEQYEEKYIKDTDIKEILKYFWISKTLLFMGCSLEKDYLIEDIFRLASENRTMYHYAILEEPKNKNNKDKKQLEMDRLKIRPIWYQNGKHDNITEILHCIMNKKIVIDEPEYNKQFAQSHADIEDICKPFLDSVAIACEPNQRNELFCSILNPNKKNELSYISSIMHNICKSNTTNALCIFGEPGTGKSTLLSLLYLEFKENNNLAPYIPIYIDLHYYEHERKSIKEAKKDLEMRINKLKKLISDQSNKALLFIDGLDEYQRNNKVLAKYVFAFVDDSNIVEKTVFAIGNISKSMGLPTGIRAIKKNREFDETITLDLINTQRGNRFSQITKHLLKLHGISLDSKDYSKIPDKIKNLAAMASGNFTDFRTVNFLVLQYKYRNEILDQPIGEIYINYFFPKSIKDLNNLAEQVTKFMIDKEKNYESTKLIHVFKSSSIRNFLFAYHYVETIINGNQCNFRYFNSIFNPCVNRFVISIINSNNKKCTDFVSSAINLYDKLMEKQQIQILYFLGRVKFEKEKAISHLLEAYKDSLNKKNDRLINDHNYLMRYRTAGIGLIYAEHNEIADDFYRDLIYNDKLKELNRLFHLDYYTNDLYTIGEERELNADTLYTRHNIERLYSSLYYNMDEEPLKGRHSYLLSILTIIDLVMYDRYYSKTPIGLYDKSGFKELIEKIAKERAITNHTIKSYITFISSNWEEKIPDLENKTPIEDENVYKSLFPLLYRLKITIRSGWLEDGRHIERHQRPESVADHIWACYLIAMIFLSEDINKCPFIKDIPIEDYKEYNKSHIIEILLVHDLAESYTGDIIGNNNKKSNLENEFMDRIKFYDSFPNFGSFRNISKLIDEYSTCGNINACIAYDIDKLEPLIQLYIYKNYLENTYDEIRSEWEESVNEKLKTTLGRKIYEFITENITH